jgi:uracil-DNA glycosylase
MDLDRETFYDETRIAIAPAGFCYPGRYERGGDRPPRPECGRLWHDALREHLPNLELTILAGQFAQKLYLRGRRKKNLTETVRAFREYLPGYVPLPHPSFRNLMWLRRNPWFDEEVLPELRRRVRALL